MSKRLFTLLILGFQLGLGIGAGLFIAVGIIALIVNAVQWVLA